MRFLVLAILLTPAAFGQHGTLTGFVTETGSGLPIPGVNVVVEGTAAGTATDRSGAYRLYRVEVGQRVVTASAVGYTTTRTTVSVESGMTQLVDFELTAGTTDLGEVVVVAREALTRGPAGVRDLPGSAHYIGPEQLKTFADTDVLRVLREVPGVDIQEEEGYGLRPNIGLRGTGSERTSKITVMEDGVLVAPAPYAAPAAYYFPTVGRMSGVEVRKGASQIKYGPYTTGGALNLLSTPIPVEFSGSAEAYLGQNAARNAHIYVGNSYRNVGFLLETYQSSVAGFKEIFPLRDADTGFHKQDYLAKLRIHTNPTAPVYQSLELKLSRTNEVSHETYLGLTADDFARTPFRRYAGSQADRMDAAQRQATLRHIAIFADWLDVTTTLYRNAFSRNWYKLQAVRAPGEGVVGLGSVLSTPERFAPQMALLRGDFEVGDCLENGLLDVRANNRDYLAYGVQSIAGLSFELGSAYSMLEIGLRIHRDEMDRLQWEDQYAMTSAGQMNRVSAGLPGSQDNRIDTADAIAAFAQAEITTGALTLTPGLRYEHVTLRQENFGRGDPERTGAGLTLAENNVSVLIPGLAGGYEVVSGVNVFAGIHRGFAPPTSQKGVRPELSVNYEVGAHYESPAVIGQAAVFFNDYSNLLGSDLSAGGGTGSTDQFNGGEVHVLGLELSGSADLAALLGLGGIGLPARIAYTYTDATFQSSFESTFGPWGTVSAGDEVPYIARHQGAASLGATWNRYSLDARLSAMGGRRTEAGSGPIPPDGRLGAHAILDLAGEVSVDGRTAVFGSVRNVLDTVYVAAHRPAGLRPGLPRTVLAGVRTSF